ncbi:MAG: ABC transporter permease, partial [Janthinobacterium lividum]|nr:ABC transporter permease [Janthinobacterium lividum]
MASKLFTKFGLPLVGLACALLLWSWGVTTLEKSTPIATAFAPLPTALALREMLGGADIWL